MLRKIREKIKTKILSKYGSLRRLHFKTQIRQATLYDFFNNKTDITVATLIKILSAIDMTIADKLPERFMEVEAVNYKGYKLEKNKRYKNKRVMFLFGSPETTQEFVLFQVENDYFELVVV